MNHSLPKKYKQKTNFFGSKKVTEAAIKMKIENRSDGPKFCKKEREIQWIIKKSFM